MMVRALKAAAAATLLALLSAPPALAVSDYPMNSSGYQRRLQESRAYVTNQSKSFLTPTAGRTPPRSLHHGMGDTARRPTGAHRR